MTPTAAMGDILRLLSVHLVNEVETEVTFYRFLCNHQWNSKPTDYGHTKYSQDVKCEPFLLMETDKMIPNYAYHRLFKIQLPNSMNCRMVLTQTKREDWSGILIVPKRMKALVRECVDGTQNRT
jgi:hypothetical protein